MKQLIDIIAKLLTLWIVNNELRRKLRTQIKTRIYGWKVFNKAKSIGRNLYVGGFSSVNRNTVIGDGVCFNGMEIHGNGNVKFGNYIHSGVECLIITQNHNYEGDLIPYDETYTYKDVEIGDFVWLGSRVMILPGTKIGEGAIIQGGSVVHGEIPPCAIAGGNPAKVFKYRDIEHFKKLEAESRILDKVSESRTAVERERERERESNSSNGEKISKSSLDTLKFEIIDDNRKFELIKKILVNTTGNRFDLIFDDFKLLSIKFDKNVLYIPFILKTKKKECFFALQLNDFPVEILEKAFCFIQNNYPFVWRFRFMYFKNKCKGAKHKNYYLLSLPATYEEFLKRFSSKYRYNLRREKKIIETKLNGTIEKYLASDVTNELIERMIELKNTNDVCHFKDAASFLKSMAVSVVYVLRINGNIEAVVIYSVLDEQNGYCSTMSYNSEYKQYSIGKYLYYSSLEDLINTTHITKLFMGGGDYDYKIQAGCERIDTYCGKVYRLYWHNLFKLIRALF